MSGTPIAGDYIKAESKASRMGVRLMAIVAEGDRGRVYLSPTQVHEMTAHTTKSERKPESELVGKCRDQLLELPRFSGRFISCDSVGCKGDIAGGLLEVHWREISEC